MNWGYNPLILTIDPNFQRDILAGDDLFEPAFLMVKLCKWPFLKEGWVVGDL